MINIYFSQRKTNHIKIACLLVKETNHIKQTYILVKDKTMRDVNSEALPLHVTTQTKALWVI